MEIVCSSLQHLYVDTLSIHIKDAGEQEETPDSEEPSRGRSKQNKGKTLSLSTHPPDP